MSGGGEEKRKINWRGRGPGESSKLQPKRSRWVNKKGKHKGDTGGEKGRLKAKLEKCSMVEMN